MAEHDGCDCAELCSMGPTCPGAMLASLPGAGCWRAHLVDTRCANCSKRVPDDEPGAIVLCSARCYGIWSAREAADNIAHRNGGE